MSDGDGEDWRALFGFDEPYDNQADAIEAAIDAGERRGFLAMEGPCGTGKTMAALTAATHLVRNTRHYENVLVVTPVKQQLQQFVEDLRTMNAGLDDPLDGVALVGKRDLCPFGREDVFPRDASTHDRCEDLRENTAGLVEADEGGSSYDGEQIDDLTALRPDDATDEAWWDPVKGRELARAARADDPETIDSAALATAGAESPYVPHQPAAPDDFTGDTGDSPLYCPFEADWYGRNKGSPVGFDHAENNVVTVDELLPQAVERGTCPHRAQSVLLEAADVIVGNYNHLFDPQSRPLIEGVVDEQTFVIVDEAHRIEERVRDLLSDRIGRHTLVRARNDFNTIRTRARQSRESEQEIESELRSYEISMDLVEEAHEFVDDVVAWLDRTVAEHIEEEFGPYPDDWPERDEEIPLRDPETDEPDGLTRWAEENGYTGDTWRALAKVGTAVEAILDEEDRNTVCGAVGTTLTNWWERDHATYFREIELEHSPKDIGETSNTWERVYTPALVMYNCMPARQVQETLAGLGGGVLMSATLEPIDVFRAVTGLDALAEGEGDEDARPVEERSYDLPFPEENRASWIVDANPFTARNRGDPTADNENRTREQYRHALRTIARSPGNVMVCMPNYREAAWAGDYLEDVVEKPVLVDASTTNEETEMLKREFFRGDGKVLVTSTRGTLTEGVDYDGDKLHACAVVGVPLVNIGSPRVRAVRRAYADAFGESNAFEYALTVPAVRRARQAIGRVVRGRDEKGIRAFVGNRYVAGAPRSVHGFLAPDEREEFVRMTPEFLKPQVQQFWRDER